MTFPFAMPVQRPQFSAAVSLGGATGAASASSVALTTIAAIPAGALSVVGVFVGKGTTISVSSVSDGTNTYTLAKSSGYSANTSVLELWSCEKAVGVASGATITATFSSTSTGGTNAPIIVAGYTTGALTAVSLDKTASTTYTGPDTAYASGSTGTLTQANEIAFGLIGGNTQAAQTAVTEGTGFTVIKDQQQATGNQWFAHLGYQIVGATTALNYQPSLSVAAFGASLIATFKGF